MGLCTQAIATCKIDLIRSATLAYHAPHKQLSLMGDASNITTGAILNILNERFLQPLAFPSRKLNPTEQIYSTYDRQLTANLFICKTFTA